MLEPNGLDTWNQIRPVVPWTGLATFRSWPNERLCDWCIWRIPRKIATYTHPTRFYLHSFGSALCIRTSFWVVQDQKSSVSTGYPWNTLPYCRIADTTTTKGKQMRFPPPPRSLQFQLYLFGSIVTKAQQFHVIFIVCLPCIYFTFAAMCLIFRTKIQRMPATDPGSYEIDIVPHRLSSIGRRKAMNIVFFVCAKYGG